MTLHSLCEVMLVRAARDGQFEQCWISWRVVWPCVIAVLYWAVCLSCQMYCSFLAAAARLFTPSINLQAPCLYDLLLGHCIDFYFFSPASSLCYPSDERRKNKWQTLQKVIKSSQKDNILVSLLSGINHMAPFCFPLFNLLLGQRHDFVQATHHSRGLWWNKIIVFKELR